MPERVALALPCCGHRARRRAAGLLAAVVVLSTVLALDGSADAGDASASTVRVQLPAGMSIEVPQAWQVRSPGTSRIFDVSRTAVLDLSTLAWASLGDAVVASSRPRSTYAYAAVSFSRRRTFTQSEVKSLTAEDLRSDGLRRGLEQRFALGHMGSVAWHGVRSESVGGRIAVVAEFTRRSPERPAVWVQINQIHLGDRVVSLTLAYREAEAARWQSVVHHVRRSFHIA